MGCDLRSVTCGPFPCCQDGSLGNHIIHTTRGKFTIHMVVKHTQILNHQQHGIDFMAVLTI